jgi:imidazolonepropionase-like amidohydrolase
MKQRRSRLRLLLPLALAGSCAGLPQEPVPPDPVASRASVPLVLENVRVVSMTSEAILADRTVIIRDGKVEAIGDASLPRPEGALVIAGRGRYLLPSLIDMHVHIRTGDLPAYPRAGITTVRNMWGWPGLPALAARVERGEAWGPRIISASQGLDAEPVQWPATVVVPSAGEAAAAVRAQHQAGWRYLKVYTRLSRETYAAIMDEAHATGMIPIGHVPSAVPVEEAIARGQRSIEHLTGYDMRVSRSGRQGTWAWVDADPSRYSALATLTEGAGVWNCPTLAIFVALSRQHPPAERPVIAAQRRRFVRDLHAAGAWLLAGSDAGIDVVAPGVSLHDELAEFVAAGLTPFQALRTATIEAGRFLEIPALGTLTVGAPADLLLVDGNPLADLARLRAPSGLVHRGAWIPAGSDPAPAPGR